MTDGERGRDAALVAEAAGDFVGLSIFDEAVPTPFPYVDLDVLERNVSAMAQRAASAGVGLRPHAKAHKTVEIARRQLAAGAVGLTVAKLGEANAFIAAGVHTSYLIAQPFAGGAKLRWALQLAEQCELLASVDDLEAAGQLAAHAAGAGRELDVVLVVDAIDYGRFGVSPAAARATASAIASLPGLRLRGIQGYPGILYHLKDPAESGANARRETDVLAEVVGELRADGIACDVVSTGNTPGATWLSDGGDVPEAITELRPGNYVFTDREQITLGTSRAEDTALRVVASVVSAVVAGRGILDCGAKTLSGATLNFGADYGAIANRDGLQLDSLWEECSRVLAADGAELHAGERLLVIPNHSCEVANLAEVILAGRNERIDEVWHPVARGKVW